jgi:N utilization substance protein B
VEGVRQHFEEIDKIIEECAPEWPIDKIAKIDLVILQIAIFEMLFGKKTPVKVAIDEAVEIAKEFGNDTSHKFVNGVLGTVVEKYIPEEKDKILEGASSEEDQAPNK